MINALPDMIRHDPGVDIDPGLDPSKPIVYPDGTAVPGQSVTAITEAAVSCGGTAWGPPGVWGPIYTSSCAVFGYPGAVIYVGWQRGVNISARGCVKTKGFYPNGDSFWLNIGCGVSGGSTVAWGNKLASPKVQVQSTSPPLGFTVNWWH